MIFGESNNNIEEENEKLYLELHKKLEDIDDEQVYWCMIFCISSYVIISLLLLYKFSIVSDTLSSAFLVGAASYYMTKIFTLNRRYIAKVGAGQVGAIIIIVIKYFNLINLSTLDGDEFTRIIYAVIIMITAIAIYKYVFKIKYILI